MQVIWLPAIVSFRKYISPKFILIEAIGHRRVCHASKIDPIKKVGEFLLIL
jgi:hypothetical protein